MRTQIVKLLGVGFVAALVAACGGGAPEAEPVQVSPSLGLTHAQKERVAGRFVRDNVTIVFDSVRTDAVFRFAVESADGRPLVRGERIGDQFRTVFFDGRLTLGYAINGADDVKVEGDEAAIAELEKTPEYAALPWLSHELGRLGYNGRDYPAALAMHMFNRGAAERTNVTLPKADVIGLAGGDVPYCQAYPNQGNNCYGMCGPNCSCWSFVCGDCCYHGGCAQHDSYCRGSGFWDKVKCYTTWGAAFFGC